jgi:hypothetical protein
VLRKHGGAPAGKTEYRLEAGLASGAHGYGETRAGAILTREGKGWPRAVEAKRGRQLTGGHAAQDRSRDGRPECRVVGEGLAYDA